MTAMVPVHVILVASYCPRHLLCEPASYVHVVIFSADVVTCFISISLVDLRKCYSIIWQAMQCGGQIVLFLLFQVGRW